MARLWVPVVMVSVAASCTTLLGNEFEISDGDDGGPGGSGGALMGGAGGVGGGVGGGDGGEGGTGGGELAYFDCEWDLAEHRRVASLEAAPNERYEELFVVRRGPDAARIVTHRSGGVVDEIDVFSVDGSQTAVRTHEAVELYSASRVGTSDIGILFRRPVRQMWLLVIGDGEDTASPMPIADGNDLPNALIGTAIKGKMTGVPSGGLDDWQVDVAVGFRETLGEHVLYYSRHDGSGRVVDWTLFSDANEGFDDDDTEIKEMVHTGGTTHAFFGDDIVRAYAFDGTIPGILTARPLGPQTDKLFDIQPTPYGYANIAMASISNGIRIHVGSATDAEMGSFTIAELTEALSVPTSADLPIGPEGTFAWHGDVALWLGAEDDNGTNMTYMMFDNEGNERAQGALPFTAILPADENREAISTLDVALRSEEINADGGTFHVAWYERHVRNDASFSVLYYDRLRCAPR